MNHILELISTIVVPGTTVPLVAKEKFVCGATGVKIVHLGYKFIPWFLSGDGKIEDPINEQILRYAKPCEPLRDMHIVPELGGEEKAETTLTEIHFLMSNQGSGQDGALLNNGPYNIFYVRDIAGELRAVRVSWNSGWVVTANIIMNPNKWDSNYRVFSRAS